MAPEWEKAASSLKGIVNLAAIDASGQNINVPGLQGFPTIRFLVDGNEKEYKGGRTARDFVAYALEEVKKVLIDSFRLHSKDLTNQDTTKIVMEATANRTMTLSC